MAVMICHSKACLMSVNLQNHKDLVDSSIKQIGQLNQVKISEVYHCDGLLLCVTEKDWRLVVWNPYLGQIRWIQRPRNEFGLVIDMFAIGYDSNNNHKILKLHHPGSHEKYEIYDFKCSSWRFLGVTTDRYKCRPGVNLKGNTYLIATRSLEETTEEFLVCFGFTSETFGPRLPLPFHSVPIDDVQLSVVREEKLAVFFHKWNTYEIGIWITTKIDHNIVLWRNFLKIEHNMPLTDIYQFLYGSFFVDEKKKAAMFFYADTKASTKYKAYVVGENGYYQEVDLRENKSWKLMCSYVPSSVQISSKVPSTCKRQKTKRKR